MERHVRDIAANALCGRLGGMNAGIAICGRVASEDKAVKRAFQR